MRMPRTDCPQCRRRLPYAARRCALCGWSAGAEVDEGLARRHARRRTVVVFAILLGLAAGGGVASMRSAELADWYADFAAQHLPERLSSFALTDTELGAFFFCARQVVREMRGDFSVETFPSPEESEFAALGEGRYRVSSHVSEARVDGTRVEHDFECTVHHASGRWRLEDLRIR